MTKIKNTKKGMAKKTLSMSLVVAMLATSNVPVWATDMFSDGTGAETVESDSFTDATVQSDEDAPAVQSEDTVDAATGVDAYADPKCTVSENGDIEWGNSVDVTISGTVYKNLYNNDDDSFAYTDYIDSLTYQWYVDDVAIDEATGTIEADGNHVFATKLSLDLKKEYVGKKIKLKLSYADIKKTYSYEYNTGVQVKKQTAEINVDQVKLFLKGNEITTNPITLKESDIKDLSVQVVDKTNKYNASNYCDTYYDNIAPENKDGVYDLTKDTDYTITYVEKNANEKIAKISFKNHFNYEDVDGKTTYDFNVTKAEGQVDQVIAKIVKNDGSDWNNQWGVRIKSSLDTKITPTSYTWQVCDAESGKDEWKDIQGEKNEYLDVTQKFAKYGKDNSDFFKKATTIKLRQKITYYDGTDQKDGYTNEITVQPKEVSSDNITLKDASGNEIPSNYKFTSKAELDGVTVYVGSDELAKGTAYTVDGYVANYIGDYTVSFNLASPYKGAKIMNINTSAFSLANATVTLEKQSYEYNTQGIKPSIKSVTLELPTGPVNLTEGKDYTTNAPVKHDVTAKPEESNVLDVSNGVDLTVTGKDKYTGSASTKFIITPASLDNLKIVQKSTTRPVGKTIVAKAAKDCKKDEVPFTDYFDVYDQAGKIVDPTTTTNGINFKITDTDTKNIAGLKTTVTISGAAKSATDYKEGQNFYGSKTLEFETVTDSDIFADKTETADAGISSGDAFLSEIAKAINGPVFVVNGNSTNQVKLDDNTKAVVYSGKKVTFSGLNRLKHVKGVDKSGNNIYEDLIAGVDYDVTYSQNTNAALHGANPAPTITITMRDSSKYTGSRTFKFDILQKKLSEVTDVTAPIVFNPLATKANAKEVYAPQLKLSYNGMTLEDGKDYTDVKVKWNVGTDEKDTSTGNFTITAKAHYAENANDYTTYEDGNYAGNIETTEKIVAKKLTATDIKFADIANQEWTGKAIRPTLTITDLDGKYTLVEGTDYTTEWSNNVAAGTATVKVIGKAGRYTGTLVKTFNITSTSLEKGKIVKEFKPGTDASVYKDADGVLLNEIYKDGAAITPSYVVVDANNNKLQEGRDYTVTYKDNVNVGTATMVVEGKGSYSGTLTTTFKIVGDSLKGKFNVTSIADQTYTGEEIKPAVKFTAEPSKLVEGKDYEIVYVNNVNCYTRTGKEDLSASNYPGAYVEAHGIGNYAGKIRVAFDIVKADLTSSDVTVSDAEYAGGKVAVPTLTVKNPVSGKALTEGTDYTVKYKGGVNVGDKGEAIITLKNTDNYTINGKDVNTLSVHYNVVAKDLSKVSVATIADQIYTGSQLTPAVTVMNGDVLLTPDVDYTVSYGENKEVGNGTVTITAKGKNYKGTKEVTFKIVEAKLEVGAPMISDVKVVGNKATVILSGEAEGAAGYDYVISTDKDCITNKNYVSVNKNQVSTSTPFKYVQKGTYYAYCHAWTRDANGKKVFGEWSEGKKFKVTAITPDAPVITNVKVSGSTIKVTYKAAANATGYDVVLGTSSKKENGETRPYHYGDHKVLNLKEGTVTATFKKVPKGTWVVGMHAFNRTSEDGKKVFSPWSNLKKATVK